MPKPAYVKVSGYIKNQSGVTVANIPVTLSSNTRLRSADTNTIAVTNTNDTGYFEFNNVLSGEYIVTATLPDGTTVNTPVTAGIEDTETEDIIIDHNKYQDKYTQDTATITAEGTVITAPVIVTVPTSLSFIIQPQATNTLYTVPSTIENNSNIPLDLTIQEVTKVSDTAPDLVLPTTYTDWTSLSAQETESKIAIGLKTSSQDNWLNDKFSLSANTELQVEPCVKYGLNWTSNRDDLDYNISLLVSLKE